MEQVNIGCLRDRDLAIDLESGFNGVIDKERPVDGDSSAGWNGLLISNRSNENEEDVSLGTKYLNYVEGSTENGKVANDKRLGGGGGGGEEEVSPLSKKVGGEKPKKKSCKKPPKPPRPPRAPSMDAADQKLVREISELAMLKRARIERMKALKRMKNAKSASSNINLVGLVITIIFCFVIIWQGLFSRGGSSVSFQGSPESSAGTKSGFISVQFYKNVSTNHDSSSASPNKVELMSGLDDHGEVSRGPKLVPGMV